MQAAQLAARMLALGVASADDSSLNTLVMPQAPARC